MIGAFTHYLAVVPNVDILRRNDPASGVDCHFLSPFAQNAHPDMNIRSFQTNEIIMAFSVAPMV
jgi:hypothetical protein